MSDRRLQDGFRIICKALSGTGDWVDDWESIASLPNHPFVPDYSGMVDFAGEDIYLFLRHGLAHNKFGPLFCNDVPFVMYFHLVEGRDNPEHHHIFAELRDELSSLLVAGMTDFSTSGKHAYQRMQDAFGFLSTIYQATIVSETLGYEAADKLWQTVNQLSTRTI